MSKRKESRESQETFINGRRVVGGIDAAKVLTKKAEEQGSSREYSRDTIYRHYTNGTLIPAAELPAGNLYYVEDIEALPISPERGAKSGQPHRKKQKSNSPKTGIKTS